MSIEVFGDLPLNLVLLRHGQSVRNAANQAKRTKGIPVPDEVSAHHDSFAVLTPEAIPQTELTGAYLRTEFPDGFDRYITSDIPRALQTAIHLELPNAEWDVRGFWRERDWGEHTDITEKDSEAYRRSHAIKKSNPYQWGPRGGESQSTGVATRLRLEEFDLRHNPPHQNVLVVAHGDVMLGALKEYGNDTIAEWNDQFNQRSRVIPNNMMIHLSRLSTDRLVAPHFQRLRGVCVWDRSRSWNNGEWIDIRPPQKYTNDELRDLFVRSMPKNALHTEVRGDF